MKRSFILILCGLLVGIVAAWPVFHYVVPRWHRSAVDNTFWQVTSKLDQGGEAFAYAHTEQIVKVVQDVLSSLNKSVDALPEAHRAKTRRGLEMANIMIKGYGLDEISGLGFSSFAVKPGLHRVRMVLHHRPGRSKGLIWNIAGPVPRFLDEMELLPVDTALAFVSDYNLVKLIEWVSQVGPKMAGQGAPGAQGQTPDQAMAMIKAGLQTAGIDADRLFKSYGGRMGFLLTLDPEKRVTLPLAAKPLSIPEPAFALLVRVNDSYLFDMLKNKLVASGKAKISGNGELNKIVFPRLPLPIPFEPVIAQKGEWLLAASRSAIIDNILGGGARLVSGEAFREIAYKMPRRGNGFGYASPLLPRLVAQILRENLLRGGNMASASSAVPLEKVIAFLEGAKGFCQVWENSDQGLVYTVNHGFEISSLPGLIEAFVEIAEEKAREQAAASAMPAAGEEP